MSEQDPEGVVARLERLICESRAERGRSVEVRWRACWIRASADKALERQWALQGLIDLVWPDCHATFAEIRFGLHRLRRRVAQGVEIRRAHQQRSTP